MCLCGVALYLSTLNLGKWMEFLMNTVKLMASTKAGSLEKTSKLIRIVVQPVPGKYKQAYYVSPKISLCDLPDCGVLLNRTPSLNLTGFESVIVVLNTFARPSTCNTRFRADFEMSMNKPWEHMKCVDKGKNLLRIKHYHGRQNQPLPGRSQNLLCSWHSAR